MSGVVGAADIILIAALTCTTIATTAAAIYATQKARQAHAESTKWRTFADQAGSRLRSLERWYAKAGYLDDDLIRTLIRSEIGQAAAQDEIDRTTQMLRGSQSATPPGKTRS